MLIFFFSVSLQIKAKNYDKVEKVSPLKYTLNFMLKFSLGFNICEANTVKC